MDKINTIFNADSVEKILENLANDKSDWSTKQLNILGKMSPTALKVTFEQRQLPLFITILRSFSSSFFSTIISFFGS